MLVNRTGRALMLLFILFVCVACDQGTKSVAQTHLSATEPILLLDGVIRLQVMENPGAFLSLGAGLPEAAQYWVFTVMVATLLVGMAVYLFKAPHGVHHVSLLALALLLGGGIGNLIDRLMNEGRVIDFMNIGIGNLRTGVFNVADMAITAGVTILLLNELRAGRKSTLPTPSSDS